MTDWLAANSALQPNPASYSPERPPEFYLTIVVPVYNLRNEVSDTLESLAELKPAAHEVIIVDDGSTDGSGDLVRTFIQERSLPHFSYIGQQNSGVSSARNTGLRVATGDWVLFLDGDDRVEPSLVGELATRSKSDDSSPDIIFWPFRHLRYESEGRGLVRWDRHRSWSTGFETLGRILLEGASPMWTASAAYRVDFLKENQISFTEGCASGEDVEFNWKALAIAKHVQFIDSVLSTYIWRPGSMTDTFSVAHFDSLFAYRRASQFLARHADAASIPIVRAAREKELPRFVEYLKQFARDHTGTPAQIINEIESRNPGTTKLFRDVLIDRVRLGASVTPNQWLLAIAPKLWLARLKRQWRLTATSG